MYVCREVGTDIDRMLVRPFPITRIHPWVPMRRLFCTVQAHTRVCVHTMPMATLIIVTGRTYAFVHACIGKSTWTCFILIINWHRKETQQIIYGSRSLRLDVRRLNVQVPSRSPSHVVHLFSSLHLVTSRLFINPTQNNLPTYLKLQQILMDMLDIKSMQMYALLYVARLAGISMFPFHVSHLHSSHYPSSMHVCQQFIRL